MARFALFTNGVKVETLDELKENFNITDMLENYRNKALHRWLMINRMTGELSLVEAITETEDDAVIDELTKIFGVSAETIEEQKRVLEENAKKSEDVLSELEKELLTDIERTDFMKYMDDSSDPQNIIALLQKHAGRGNPVAQLKLGYCFECEKCVEKNLELAVGWYKKSAEQGLARAQNQLGYCFQNGIGVAKDNTQAVSWYQKSADQDFHYGLLNLGFCYEDGIGVEKNLTEAVNFYKKAADLKNHQAEYKLARCYDIGAGIEENKEEASRLYHIAADAGDPQAQVCLGINYEYGTGGEEKNLVKALEWYRKAAQQSFNYAQFSFFKLWFTTATDDNDNEQLVSENADDAIRFLSLANNEKNNIAKAWCITLSLLAARNDDAPPEIKKHLSAIGEDDGIAQLKSLDIDSNELQTCLGLIYTTIYDNGSSKYLSGVRMLQASQGQSTIAKNILDQLPGIDISHIEISFERFSSNILFNGHIKTLGEYFISISYSSGKGNFIVKSKDGKTWEEFHEANSGFNYADYVSIYSLASANNHLFVFSNQKIVEIDENLDVSFHDNSLCGDKFNGVYVDVTHNGDQYVIKAKVNSRTTIYRVRNLSFYATFQKEWFDNENYEMNQLQYFKGKYYGTTYLNGQRDIVVSDDGSHFSTLTKIQQDNCDHTIYRFDDILFITGGNHTYYTKDGEDWESLYVSDNFRDIRKSNNLYYARASEDIYISNDGTSWRKVCSVDDQYNYFEVNSADKLLLYDLAMPGSSYHKENRYLSGEIR